MRWLFGTFMTRRSTRRSTNLQRLEGVSIHIMHEVVAEALRPTALHSAMVPILGTNHG